MLECTASGGGSLSAILAAAQAGQLTAADALHQLRALCDHAISTSWRTGQHAVAQAASELLDEGNELLAELGEGPAASGGATQPVAMGQQPQEPAVSPRLQLPAETFFLDADQLRECLTLNIDSSILMAAQPPRRTGGWPLGRKRKGDGIGGAALGKRKTGSRQFNPWTPELQQQLSMVLRLALRSPGAGLTRLPSEEVAHLSPALASLAGHLHSSAAGEQLQSMGTTLASVVSMLQVAGFTDFEEMLNDVRDECHAAVEAYLTVQNVEVRRGRLVAHVESFINMLGMAIETLLNQIRADHRAAVEAAGGVEEDSEAEDDFYPASLPDCILANKEPFKGGDWRKTPYIPRPYVRLTEYDIVEPEMRDIILRKLSTKKHGGCDGNHCKSRKELGCYNVVREGFETHCSCLARNTECDAHCACQGSPDCLNRAVSERNTLKLGTDAEEVDSWGMDCYVRRNILDAVLESGAFGNWSPPDYQALKAAGPVEYAALRAAATGNSGGTAASPAAAVLPKAPTAAATQQQALAAGARPHGEQAEGLSGTPLAARRTGSGELGDGEDTAAIAALHSPPPTPAQIRVETRVAEWLERELLPAINRQGDRGWDLQAALADVKQRAQEAGSEESAKAAEAVEQRIKDVGYNYFRLHPKGVGLVCKRKGGLPPLTFVEEYLGEIHTPWRWFEIQDAVKKITGDELPDFYNIVLERPKDDPDGYDVLFIDAAAKGALASRMSHSCTPNCQAIVMACNGRLTIALYTLRQVYEGEELTFDYSSVTESEKEFREAICLCSTRNCRGSYLYFTGSRAFQQVMAEQHNFLHRQVIITRAGSEPLTQDDLDRIKRHGLGDSALGSMEHGDRAPDWLIKWTSLICEFIEEEEAHLKEDLLSHPQGIYNEVTATAEAKGVVANRLQNVVITLDKVKMVLRAPNQAQGPCLRLLTDEEAAEYLWDGPRSVARRVLHGCIQAVAPIEIADTLNAANTDEELQWAVRQHAGELPAGLAKLCSTILQPSAGTFEDARQLLMEVYRQLRALDLVCGGGLTAVADVLLLYAATLHWFTCERGYRGVTSSPVPLNLEDLTLDRAQPANDSQTNSGEPGSRPGSRPSSMHDLPSALGGGASESEGAALSNISNLRKVYRPMYIWGQLSGWFKQTVNDPTASLSAERRGTISLPDIESSCFAGHTRYTAKDRSDLIEQLEKRPDAMWRTGTIWSFKNDLKVYGAPALDAVWDCATGNKPAPMAANPLPGVLAELRSVDVPWRLQVAVGGGSSKGARGKKK